MESYILGIDIGTGSTKAVAVTPDGRTIGVTQAAYRTDSPSKGYSEQDPEAVWKAFVHCFREITHSVSGELVGVSLSSVMHSMMAVDHRGIGLTKLITWADSRAADIALHLRQSELGEYLYRTTGTPVCSISLLAKITWFRQNQPDIFKAAHKFISIKEFIWYKLFKEFQADHSIASATGLLNNMNLEWDKKALEIAGIGEDKLSALVGTGFTRSDLDPVVGTELGIANNISFVIGASDGCLANLGTFALADQSAAITIGTSGAVRVASKTPLLNYGSMTFNYLLDETTFICGGPVNNGGIAIQWLIRDFLKEETVDASSYAKLFQNISQVPPGAEGLIFLPYLFGERAPIWDVSASAMFFGIHGRHQQGHFCRSVLEGVCFALREVLEIVESSGAPIKQIQVSGGFTGSESWMQMLADIIGKPLHLVHTNDASAIGAVYLAMKALNLIPDYSAINRPEEHVIYPNRASRDIYQKNFSIFKQLYRTLEPLMHQ